MTSRFLVEVKTKVKTSASRVQYTYDSTQVDFRKWLLLKSTAISSTHALGES